MVKRRSVLAVLVVLALPAGAGASGYEYPENGARALARGGPGVADPGDPTAMMFNPAGLAALSGTRLLLDGHFAFLNTRFQRRGLDENGRRVDIGEPVSNGYAPWIAPFLGATYQLTDDLTLGLAVYGPSAYGAQSYPDPRKIAPEFYDGDPNTQPADPSVIAEKAPQRYNLIESFIPVIYPTLAVGWAPTDWLSIGVSGQVVLSETRFSQSIYGGLAPGEDPNFEGIAEFSGRGQPAFTGILGVQVRPADALTLGFSLRPGFDIVSEGTLNLTFNDGLTEAPFNIHQTGNEARLTSPFPTVYRFGASIEKGGITGSFDAVYEAYSAVDAFLLEPYGVVVESDIFTDPIEVAALELPKRWRDAVGLRFGLSLDLKGMDLLERVPLTVHLGYAFSQAAIPEATQGLDFFDGNRQQFTGGLEYSRDWYTVTLAVSHAPTVRRDIARSEVVQVVAPPPGSDYEGTVVGTGVYEHSLTLLVVGLQAHFGG